MHPHLVEDDEAPNELELKPIAYSTRQAAVVSSLSLREVMKAIATGELKSFKKGRRRIIFRQDLEAYLRSSGEQK
jgi:excisionase family DNA binding protein